MMIKNKKFMMILAAFVLSIALTTAGCNAGIEGEAVPGEEDSINAPENTGGEEPAAGTEEPTGEAQTTANAEGTVKAFDAGTGMITIAVQSGETLELKVTGESKIFISESTAGADKLSAIIGSEVSVEYSSETNTVTKINVKG
ncbi:MAG TPA: hypothetical protein VN580_10325, partial [Clostridia bacterium]|nr:hypothetical protein [Clostridia bacterium]